MKYIVYHAINPTFSDSKPRQFPSEFEKVAEVECDNLDDVFEFTNHIYKPWWENDEVCWYKQDSRSTSVGDVVVDAHGKKFMCKFVGWEQI